MKKISSLLIILFAVFSCKAQQIYPLNTYPLDVPAGSYMKDINNELNPYIGNWNATYNGTNINLINSKEEHKSFKLPGSSNVFFQDVLIVKYTIKDASNNTLQTNSNSLNEIDKNFIASISVRSNNVHLYYTGTTCRIGIGEIILKKLSVSEISWSYYPSTKVTTDINCPGNSNVILYLPDTENLVFTKQ